MNTKQKIASGLVTLALVAGSCFGGRTVYNAGYESGRQAGKQEVKNELTTAGNIYITNYKRDLSLLKDQVYDSTGKEQKHLQELYGYKIEQTNILQDLMNEVLDDSIQIGVR
ncbi:MAG: hypothetical protein PHH54_05945 [Candidatus Nanoarchaeia archaeon]|nr:hypothetical protein [Candidatus Nanoarchaeia archaeon]MDD5741496.1 hypothetical protein [Candidatus Nanoarchaeia archaeon]